MLQIEQIKPSLSRRLPSWIGLCGSLFWPPKKMPHPHFYPVVGDPAEMCIDVKIARECSSHGICPLAGPGVLLISTSIPRGWGLRGAELTCGLSSSGTSGEHLGSHQMGHLPPQVHSPQLAAAPGDLPKGPSCSSARPSQHWCGAAGSLPSSTPFPQAPSPNFRIILASPLPQRS